MIKVQTLNDRAALDVAKPGHVGAIERKNVEEERRRGTGVDQGARFAD